MERIYLDANATTPVLPEVIEAMLPHFSSAFGNPSSTHYSGQRARQGMDRARVAVAKLLNCDTKEIVFTSGGTESDNLALCGILQPYLDRREPAHLVTTQIEHHAVSYAAEGLERRGLEVTYLAPNRDGLIEPEAFEAALKPHTRLVSVMMANNETGVIQPLGKLARIAKARGILVHSDAVQSAAKMTINMSGEFKNVDLLSISGHKIYAPQGTGVLFLRKGLEIAPMFLGGPHEAHRRAGTENVPGIVALGRACELAGEWLASDGPARTAALRDKMEQGFLATIPDVHINGTAEHRTMNTCNLRIDGVDAEALLIALDLKGIAASFGAACQSGATASSHVLRAMGMTQAEARSSLRLSLSRTTTEAEIDRVLEILPAVVSRLRSVVMA
jgi:cysteine desulfurase